MDTRKIAWSDRNYVVQVTPITLHWLPQHDVVVASKLEQAFVFENIVPKGEYTLEVPGSVQLLRAL